ncbi:hypothetical protein EVA_20189 [gut metagenome]|uniref:Uncharacterized protein n=1 Tax=gut metagenome TaxID=749906 RepID=J9FWI5_9ZZZZ
MSVTERELSCHLVHESQLLWHGKEHLGQIRSFCR